LLVEVAKVLVVAEAAEAGIPESSNDWVHHTTVPGAERADAGPSDGYVIVYQGTKHIRHLKPS
jgi:hypothetical protein